MKQKLNKKSKNRRKTCKTKYRKKSTTRKHKKCRRGGMKNENNNNVEECSLCFAEISIQDDRIMFRNLFACRHDFHKECIINWINTKKIENTLFVENEEGDFVNSMTCPLCRAELSDRGSQIIDTVDRILDMNDRSTRRNMFRDLLQYDYPYDANEDTFFRLYVLPVPRRIYGVGRRLINFEFSNTYAVGTAAIYFFLSFVITGNDSRQTLTRSYSNFRTLQFFRGIFNVLAVTYLPNNNEFRDHRINAVTSIFVIFLVLNLDNIFTNTPTEINTFNGRISMVNIVTELITMFERFLVEDSDFLRYFNQLNDPNNREPNGRFGGSAQTTNTNANSSNKKLRFKFTSMEDVKEFLDIVDNNKTKLESLLDKVPFTLSVFLPNVEYTPELVQKLRPLIKN